MGFIAFMYATVGHAGATGYIAIMTLFGVPAEAIRPVALFLNVIVGVITAGQFARAGYFRSHLIIPLICGSIPAALVGGWLMPPIPVFEIIVGCVLLLSAFRIGYTKEFQEDSTTGEPSLVRGVLVMAGVVLGLLSGLTGVGGGVFLTPTLLAMRVAPGETSCCYIRGVYCGQLHSRAHRVDIGRKYGAKSCTGTNPCSWCRWADWISSRCILFDSPNTSIVHRVHTGSCWREAIGPRFVGTAGLVTRV